MQEIVFLEFVKSSKEKEIQIMLRKIVKNQNVFKSSVKIELSQYLRYLCFIAVNLPKHLPSSSKQRITSYSFITGTSDRQGWLHRNENMQKFSRALFLRFNCVLVNKSFSSVSEALQYVILCDLLQVTWENSKTVCRKI